MAEKFSKFNALDYLETDKEIMEYLSACFEDDDPNTFIIALGHVAKKKGMAKVAKKAGLGRESLYKTFSADGRVKPKWDTIQRVVKAVGFEMTLKPA